MSGCSAAAHATTQNHPEPPLPLPYSWSARLDSSKSSGVDVDCAVDGIDSGDALDRMSDSRDAKESIVKR